MTLFILAGMAILGEILVVVAAHLARARGGGMLANDHVLLRVRRIFRIAAPIFLLTAGAILAWLSVSSSPGDGPPAERADGEAAASATDADLEPAVVIRGMGIGAAGVGMTLGDLRAALPADVRVGDPSERFMVDAVALPVVLGADTLYHVLFPVGTDVDDGTSLELVATRNPRARTVQDVGPGMTLADAAERYGAPTLSYSVHDESREYARFPRQPSDRLLFRVEPASGLASLAGSYGTRADYNETEAYDPAATILMVLVRLRRP